MILEFNPEEASDKSEVAQGVYNFTVENIEPRVFRTGKKGMTATLCVFLENKMVKVYENMYYTSRALWKIKELCKAVDVPWPGDGQGLDSNDLLGKAGRAYFGRDKGEKYLKVKEFLKPGASESEVQNPPIVRDEDVPF